jgi:hypothetical protein
MGDWLYLIMLSILVTSRLARCRLLSSAIPHQTSGPTPPRVIVPFLLFSEDIPVTFSRRELGLGLQVGAAEPGGTPP